MSVTLSIITPTLNEAENIEQHLNRLQSLRERGHEVIVVDGGSHDDTISLATPLCDQVLRSQQSRSMQMNEGASQATGDCLVFLHADTVLPEDILYLFSDIDEIAGKWGRFDIQLSGRNKLFRIIETAMNYRSRLTGIATGDQVFFIGKCLFENVKGFPVIALMEDIAISRLLIKYSKPICMRERVISSSRRWEKNGIIKTVIKMWVLRLLYFLKCDTARLARLYE